MTVYKAELLNKHTQAMKFVILLAIVAFAVAEDSFSKLTECSDGWRITGYYVPNEKDFTGQKVNIKVGGTTYSLKEKFVRAVKMQGSGYTEEGWILSCCWQKRSSIIGACGKPLNKLAAVARDSNLFKCKQCLKINTELLKSYSFAALDTGGAIKGKHLDVFCGSGVEGRQLANKITTSNAEVCTC